MAGNKPERTQETQPKKAGAKSVEIPVPTRKDVEDFMKGVTGQRPSEDRSPKQ